MKKLSKKLATNFCNKVDIEGLGYWLTGYTSETYPGTEVEQLIINARLAMKSLENKIEELKNRYNIGDC